MIKGRDVLLTEKLGHVYMMTINREERRNAISFELMERVEEEWETVNDDDDIWVAILTAKGDISFSSGHDLKEDMEGEIWGVTQKPTPRRRAHPDVPTWKPTITAVNGYCLAGGWYLAQSCDVRIAAEHATFGMPEVNWNLSAMFGAQHEYQISIGVAAEMLLWGRSITAQRAYETGFVNKVVPKERLLPEAMEWAEYVCKLGQPAVRAHKQLLYNSRFMRPNDLYSLSKDLFYWYPPKPGVQADPKEGARAFVEGRKSVGD